MRDQRNRMARLAGSFLAVFILTGCAEVIAEQAAPRKADTGPNAGRAAARQHSRADSRAYYCYSRSISAEIQGNLDAAIQWQQEALRYDSNSPHLRKLARKSV